MLEEGANTAALVGEELPATVIVLQQVRLHRLACTVGSLFCATGSSSNRHAYTFVLPKQHGAWCLGSTWILLHFTIILLKISLLRPHASGYSAIKCAQHHGQLRHVHIGQGWSWLGFQHSQGSQNVAGLPCIYMECTHQITHPKEINQISRAVPWCCCCIRQQRCPGVHMMPAAVWYSLSQGFLCAGLSLCRGQGHRAPRDCPGPAAQGQRRPVPPVLGPLRNIVCMSISAAMR